MELAKCKLFSE